MALDGAARKVCTYIKELIAVSPPPSELVEPTFGPFDINFHHLCMLYRTSKTMYFIFLSIHSFTGADISSWHSKQFCPCSAQVSLVAYVTHAVRMDSHRGQIWTGNCCKACTSHYSHVAFALTNLFCIELFSNQCFN